MEVKILISRVKPMESGIHSKSWHKFVNLFNDSPIISKNGTVKSNKLYCFILICIILLIFNKIIFYTKFTLFRWIAWIRLIYLIFLQYINDVRMLKIICSYRSESGGSNNGKGTNGAVAD